MDIPTVSNVMAVYNSATADDIRKGLSWYADAHNVARQLASESGKSVECAAGIIAALSPMNGWDNNKRKAIQLFDQNGIVSLNENGGNGIGLWTNVIKAQAIYRGGSPDDILKGDKVRAFYSTILDPQNENTLPVIDRHAFDVAVGERTDEKRRTILSRKGVYLEFASVYQESAKIAGIGSAQMQAIAWVAWRNTHQIERG